MGETALGHVLFVAGMHRAGTSALCAALHACGVRFEGDLLPAMAGVNEAGFWEAAEIVEINDHLLRATGASWYSVAPGLDSAQMHPRQHPEMYDRAVTFLRSRSDGAPVQAFKDPRFCLTLPFWLQLCAELNMPCSVCAIWRDPLEVARSLEHRDALPIGYGLRLQGAYLRALEGSLPANAVVVSFQALLDDATAALAELAATLPLDLDGRALSAAVRRNLRHQCSAVSGLSLLNELGEFDIDAYEADVERRYPIDETLRECIAKIVERGLEITRIGDAHTYALSTIEQKDRDIAQLAKEHSLALETLVERDHQIQHLSEALQHRDRVLKKLYAIPLFGYLVRGFVRYEKR